MPFTLLVNPYEKAVEAIGKIDKAMELISSARTKHGAYVNALEHIHNNVSNYNLNITAAEAQIRDADIPKEITKLTSKKIALEASKAMLAQANQLSQAILPLLK